MEGSGLSIATKVVFTVSIFVLGVMFYIWTLTDQIHISISIPVLLTMYGHLFIDWEKEKKNIAPFSILAVSTVLACFVAQVDGVRNESKLNIYDYCIENDSEASPFKKCVVDQNKELQKYRYLVYNPSKKSE